MPKERHQGFSSLLRRSSPELLFQCHAIIYEIVVSDQGRVRTGKQLLPAKTVKGDQKDILCFKFLQSRSRDLRCAVLRSEEHTSELQSLMRISYAVFCLNKTTTIK